MAKKKQTKEKQEEPEVEEFMEIGRPPALGITLQQVLRGHTDMIGRIAWSPDGRFLASPSDDDRTIRIWEISTGECIIKIDDVDASIVGWSPDGKNRVY